MRAWKKKVNLISLKKSNIDVDGLDDIGLYSIAAYLNNKGIDSKIYILRENKLECDSITEDNPKLILISVYNIYPCVRDRFDDVESVKLLAAEFKNKLSGVAIAIAGFPASNYWKEIMEEILDIDYVIRGECEETVYDLAQSLYCKKDVSKVNGIVYRNDNGELVLNNKREPISDLSLIPLPIRGDLENKKKSIVTIASSRGCKRNCSFCTVNDFWGKWRGRDVLEIIQEIKYIYKNYGTKRYNFIDESFEDSEKGIERWVDFSRELKKSEIKISYYIQMRAETYELLNDQQVDELINSGLCGISIGIETFNKEDRIIYGKYASVEQNIECIRFLKKKIGISFNMINFNPYSTIYSLKDNLYWLKELGYAFDITKINSYYQAQKGTRLYNKLLADSLINEPVNPKKILDMYNYSYVDSSIEYLSKFIKQYFEKEKVHQNFHYYGHEFDFLVHHIENFGRDNIEIKEAVKTYYNHVDDVFKVLNNIYAEWFERMLDMASESWNDEKAILICNTYLKTNDIEVLLKIVEKQSFILLKKVRKLDVHILA